MIDAIPKWLLAAAVATLAATSCKLKIDKDGITLELEKTRTIAAEREAEYQVERARAAVQLAAAANAVSETQVAWTAAMHDERAKTNETIRHLHRTADDLRRRLRSAEEARRAYAAAARENTGAAADAETAERSVAAVVPGETGIDLVSEALRADTIRVNLIACYEDYDRVRDALIRLNSEIVPQ